METPHNTIPRNYMVAVTLGSVFSLVNYILSVNIFTLISWISVIGLLFKFLRKEYVRPFLSCYN